jgi:valyl-tRNA synthetase
MNESIEKTVYNKTVYFFEELLLMLHPFMPFITEEVYHKLAEREEGNDLTIKQKSGIGDANSEILLQGMLLK